MIIRDEENLFAIIILARVCNKFLHGTLQSIYKYIYKICIITFFALSKCRSKSHVLLVYTDGIRINDNFNNLNHFTKISLSRCSFAYPYSYDMIRKSNYNRVLST